MDADIANLRPDLLPPSDEDKFLNLSYERRLECLRHIIIPLYLTRKDSNGQSKFIPITQVCAFMKTNYSFYAAESQYKKWFKKWGIRRRILTTEKEEIVKVLGKRSHSAVSTSKVTLGEYKEVDPKQMKRYLKDQVRHHAEKALVRTPGILLSWNLPYVAYLKALGINPWTRRSPFTSPAAAPIDVNTYSPDDGTSVEDPQAAAPSPTMQTMVNYLNDMYLYFLVKAKYWGRGPRNWTAGMVSALSSGSIVTSSPASLIHSTSPSKDLDELDKLGTPTQLCHWTIHLSEDPDDESENLSDEEEEFDIHDPNSWKKWSNDAGTDTADVFIESLAASISDGVFSQAPSEDLLLSLGPMSQSILEDRELLVVDACKAAIMARNTELIASLCEKARRGSGYHNRAPRKKIYEINPFHLAATYLDGGKSCCNVLRNVLACLGPFSSTSNTVDDLGHTILDTLIINILRSHTTVSPELVSRNFDPPNRFPGEEKSICGRWDADTPAVRQLFTSGYARIPSAWKHAFCHTSVQAICHSSISMFETLPSWTLDQPSGLFARRCIHCGLELKLGPLHTLVVVTFYLASQGMPGETLFGSLALLVCLLSLGFSPRLRTQISIAEILGVTESETCQHKAIDALELLQAVPENLVAGWTVECQTGWRCILEILVLAGNEAADLEHSPSRINQCPDSIHGYLLPSDYLPCLSEKLGIVWATIQTEFLTYRRVDTDGPWISKHFSMTALRAWLAGEVEEFNTGLMHGMIKRHSRCGWFTGDVWRYENWDYEGHELLLLTRAEDVCEVPFTNMLDEHYDRRSYVVDYDDPGELDDSPGPSNLDGSISWQSESGESAQ